MQPFSNTGLSEGVLFLPKLQNCSSKECAYLPLQKSSWQLTLVLARLAVLSDQTQRIPSQNARTAKQMQPHEEDLVFEVRVPFMSRHLFAVTGFLPISSTGLQYNEHLIGTLGFWRGYDF